MSSVALGSQSFTMGEAWNDLGWRVDVGFQKFQTPLRIKDVIGKIAHLLPGQYSPIQENGHGNQVAYLSEIPRALAAALINLAEPSLQVLLGDSSLVREETASMIPEPAILFEWEERIQTTILKRMDLPETTRKASIAARRGQGRFRQDDPHALSREIDINLISPARIAAACAGILEKQRHGTLAAFGSVAGDRGRQSNYLYGAAKSALDTFFAGLRHRFAMMPEVRITLLKPGLTDTPMTAKIIKSFLFSPASQVGSDAWKAIQKGKHVAYLPSWWRGLMFAIRLLPNFILHRTKL